MAEPARITPEETRRKLAAGEAILVCAYESDEKFEKVKLDQAISLNEFKKRLPSIPEDQEIIFYCK
ncbi:MAG TPA: hypothetical protein VJ882_06945 [Desulfuromonadales bacterium]|nr:hypothetical protein [Desulfuromonadales bacterium]